MKWDRNRLWRELASNLLNRGFIPVNGIEYWVQESDVPLRLLLQVAAALCVEEFENGGEHYWRLSGKVVPILPRRNAFTSRQAGSAA